MEREVRILLADRMNVFAHAPPGGDQLGRALQQRLDLIPVLPDEGDGLAALHHMAVLVMVRALIDDPIGRHVVADDVRVNLTQCDLEIVAFHLPTLDAHSCTFRLGYIKKRRTNYQKWFITLPISAVGR